MKFYLNLISPYYFQQVVDFLMHLILYFPQGVEAGPEFAVVNGWVEQRHHAPDEPVIL